MKKLILITALLCSINAVGQNYQITFSGTGSSTTVESVKVENLTAGTSVTLNQGDILSLNLTTGTGPDINGGLPPEITVFPNPASGSMNIRFTPLNTGEAIISLYDITGRQLTRTTYFLENHLQEFRFSGLGNGLHLISIKGKTYNYSAKVLSNSSLATDVISLQRNSTLSEVSDKPDKDDAKGQSGTVDMQYTTGDRLKFTGTSGNYSTVLTDVPTQSKTITFNFMPCTDGEGNHYPVVQIGTQIWMAKNLNTTKYLNGDAIATTSPATLNIEDETKPKYQWAYNGEESNASVYGRLYTWHAATDSRGICPADWFVPTDYEWTAMTDYLTNNGFGYEGSGDDIAKSLAAASGWTLSSVPGHSGNDLASNNSSGFSAFPGGWRNWEGPFQSVGTGGYWFTSSEYNTVNAWYRGLAYNKSGITRAGVGMIGGMAVRCMKITYPIVETTPVTIFSYATAEAGGEVKSLGGAAVNERGIFWGTSLNPVTTGTKLQIGSGIGKFSASLSGLKQNTTYYVIAYAVNSVGTSYGEELSFKTSEITAPILTTKTATSITQAKALSGGSIYSDGGAQITAKGVCWSISQNPTIDNDHTSDGTGTGSFTSYVSGLSHSTTYHLRAYATNSKGTAYGDPISFRTLSGGPIVFNPAMTYGKVTDIEGNEYKTIQAGEYVLMAENLRTKKYNDNKPIPSVTDNTKWKNLTTPAYCWYDNDSVTYKSVYGALYNWYAVQTGKICPTGWHVPSDDEYIALILEFIGAQNIAGGKMKEAGLTHWLSPNTGATNESGFTGLPAGRRYYYDGTFITIGELGYFWTSTEDDEEDVYAGVGILHYDSIELEGDTYSKPNGMSVRCLKNK